MKLTEDMFDFEKYNYRWGYPSVDDEALFGEKSQWTKPVNGFNGLPPLLLRTLKPLPRYILLNEGEKLEDGDEYYAGHPNRWTQAVIKDRIPETVLPGEIIRRKVQE